MAGRPPKPTALRLVGGNAGKRPLPVNEPAPPPGAPEMPAGLRPVAVAAWHRLSRTLGDMGVLTVADGEALTRLCDCLADLQDARDAYERPFVAERWNKDTGEITEQEIAEGGKPTYVSFGKDGVMLRTRTELALIADCDRRVRGYLADFGLTPAARSKVKVQDSGKKNDPTARYFD
jgi:P27 family predicted phage terminase small subunit